VPAGIASGRSLRLKGKGWPLRQGRGDLLLTIQLQLPSDPSPKEQEIYQQLRGARSQDPRESLFKGAKL
jgi:curved DNA-binding protein